MKTVAVIGSGIAGLSAANSLAEAGCEVHLYERSSTIGMEAFAVDAGGGAIVDVPLRVFSRQYYPQLLKL